MRSYFLGAFLLLVPCLALNETKFESQLILRFKAEGDLANLSAEVAARFQSTYNVYQVDFCDPINRTVTSVEVDQLNATQQADLTTKTFQLSVNGFCRDCNSTANLFDLETHKVVFGNDICVNVTDIRGRNVTTFRQAFQASMSEFNETFTIMDIQEQNAFFCPEDYAPFNSTLTLEYYSVCDTVEMELLEQVVLETYNSMLETDYCDPTFRILQSVELIEANLTETTLQLNFDVTGLCRGCSMDTLFDEDYIFEPSLRRQLAGVCACPTNVTNRAPTEAEFKAEIDSMLAVILEGVRCDVDCPTNVSTWEDLIIMELVVADMACYNNISLNVTDIFTNSSNDDALVFDLMADAALAMSLQVAYIDTYNEMQNDYCDPFVRQLTSAEIVTVGERNSLGNVPVEMRVFGTCGDCHGLDIRVYDVPSAVTTDTSIRRLQTEGTCTCPILSIFDYVRAPYESEFVAKYQEKVTQLEDKCVDSVADCSFGTVFATGIFMALELNTTLTETDIAAIGESFRMAVNMGYAISEASCNPEFRTVDRVIPRVVAGGRRRLEGSRDLQLDDVSDAPSSAPSLAPTFAFTGDVVLNLYVTGMCNQCGNALFLGDQVDARRRAQERNLQNVLATSKCYCPLGSEIDTEGPPAERIQSFFEIELLEREIPVDAIDAFFEFKVPLPSGDEAFFDGDGIFFESCIQYEDCVAYTGTSFGLLNVSWLCFH
jgi:hypothetical protein